MNTNITILTNYIEITNITPPIGGLTIKAFDIGGFLSFLLTCFIAWTGWKAYKVYVEQVEQAKISTIINLHNECSQIHNELINNEDENDTNKHIRYRFKLHNSYNSACAFLLIVFLQKIKN